jgi:hypothetical protein
MAFKDITKVLYDGKVKISYLDKPHMYFRQLRENWDLPETDPKAWGKKKRPKGTTTLMEDTLEKKGLMTWPMGMALKELFGFYDFTNDDGEHLVGFSKDVGTLWDGDGLRSVTKYETLEFVTSASKSYLRKKKKGGDIGNVVHDAIQHYIEHNTFDIAASYKASIEEAFPIPEFAAERANAMKDFDSDVLQAITAYNQFVLWWDEQKPRLLGAEDIIYSLDMDYCGTFDALLNINGKIVLVDWKTSNASMSKAAAASQGIYYSYFIQSAAYANAWAEMGNTMPDDLLIVSCRKNGGFDYIYASDLGLTVKDCIDWWKGVALCYRFMDQTKKKLNELGDAKLAKEIK